MSEVSVHRPSDPAGELVAWAQAASAAHDLAASLVLTQVCPDPFRGKPGEATAVILLGAEVGLSPIAALRSMYVIRGQVGMYVRSQVALVQARGHDVWTVEETDDRVTVAGRRAGWPEDRVERVTWTIARARQAGFIRRGRDNSPSQYESQPRTMLWARAAGELCRRIAADALQGISADLDEPAELTTAPAGVRVVQRASRPERVTTVELPAGPDLDGSAGPTTGPGGTSTDRPPATETVAEPVTTDDPDDGDTLEEEPPVITSKQRGLLLPTLNALGVRTHDQRVRWLSDTLGRNVGSSNEITVGEASAAIDAAQLELEERKRDARGGAR